MSYDFKPELMSPAGDFSAFEAALANGADAIYLGLKEFNARKPAKNFSNQELLIAIEKAHAKQCKVYITLNIDLKESELKQAINFLAFVNKAKVDAVIVRDYAILPLIKIIDTIDKFTPELHFSTQGGASTIYDLRFLYQEGFPRVVLARELNLQEISDMAKEKNIPELEIFIHGSMCFSFSGRCNFSSWLGGKSANRGACLAPCRFSYSTQNISKQTIFNMKDLNLFSKIQELKKINIKAYKIEGRLKNSGWVGAVTKFYRKLLDNQEEYSQAQLTELNKELQLFSGREISTGFLQDRTNLTGSNSVRFGKFLGKIKGSNNEYYETDILPENFILPLTLRFFKNKFLSLVKVENSSLFKVLHSKQKVLLSKKLLGSNFEIDTEIFQVQTPTKEERIAKGKYNISALQEGDILIITIVSNLGKTSFRVKLKEIKKSNRAQSLLNLIEDLQGRFFKGLVLGKATFPDILIARSQFKHLLKGISEQIIRLVNSGQIEDFSFGIKEFKKREQEYSQKNSNFNTITPENINCLRLSVSQVLDLSLADILSLKSVKVTTIEVCSLHLYTGLLDGLRTKIELLLKQHFKIYFDLDSICLFSNLMQWKKNVAFLLKSSLNIKTSLNGIIINNLGHFIFLKELAYLDKYELKGGEGLAVLNSWAANYLREKGLAGVMIKSEIDFNTLQDILLKSHNNYRLMVFGKIPLFVSRVNMDSFKEETNFEDQFGNSLVLCSKGEWSYFYSKEFFSAFTQRCKDLKIADLVADFTSEKLFDVKFFIDLKNGNKMSDTKDFNLNRKLF